MASLSDCSIIALNVTSLLLKIERESCMHEHEPNETHPNISSFTANLIGNQHLQMGNITVQLLNKSAMEAIGPGQMWEECQAYDTAHAPTARIKKVENHLANETFPPEKQTKLDSAESLLFIEEACIDPRFRKRGLSLLALDSLIKRLALEERCVILLQAGPVTSSSVGRDYGTITAVEACEKIARHWGRLGFRVWSDTDNDWLCLLAEQRPRIEDVVPELFTRWKASAQSGEA